MKNADIFDVLIVYSSRVAKSASLIKYTDDTPFPTKSKHAHYHTSYAYLLQLCAERNLTSAFTTSADILGAGVCRSYWILKANKWKRVRRACRSNLIFDKFFPRSARLKKQRKLLFSSPDITSFSNAKLFELFSDKLKTHQSLPAYAIPTVNVSDNTSEEISSSVKTLRAMISTEDVNEDFSKSIILKDRYGAGGTNVYKIKNNFHEEIGKIMGKNMHIDFVLQPFVEFGGYAPDSDNSTEIRLLYLGQKMVQAYSRSAKDRFLCNDGSAIKVEKEAIPAKIISVSSKIAEILGKKFAFFALDFVVSNSGTVYLLEGNISPGLYWEAKASPENIKMNKCTIGIIVDELARRIHTSQAIRN
jgi:hypothetical protein